MKRTQNTLDKDILTVWTVRHLAEIRETTKRKPEAIPGVGSVKVYPVSGKGAEL